MFIYEMSETVTDKFRRYFCTTYIPVYQCYLLVETYVLEKIIIMCIDVKILHTTRLVLKCL